MIISFSNQRLPRLAGLWLCLCLLAGPRCAAIETGAQRPKNSILLLADGLSWGNEPMPELADLRIAQSTRAYQPMFISHYGASWVDSSNYPAPAWPGNGWDRKRLEEHYAKWADVARKGVGVHCGEGGAFNKTPHPVVLAWREADGQAVLLRDEGEGFDAVARPFVPIRPDHVALNAGVSGRITLAATSAAEALLTVLEFDLEGKELGRQLLPLEQGGRSLHWLDLDLDTRRDLLVLNEQTPSLSIFYLQADGTYRGSGQALAKKPYLGFGLTTVDADRLPDLVLLDERGFSISRHEHGLFSALLEVHSSVRPTALEVLRDGEHRLVAVLSGTESTLELFAFTVMPTDTPLAAEDFSSVEADRYRELLRVNNGPELLRTGFVDDDQKPDFLTLSNRSRSVSILFGKYLRYHADQAF